MRTDVPPHTLQERPATSWTAPRCPDMHGFHAGPFSCYLLLQVWGKVHPVLERLQTKPLPGLVVGGQAKVAPALQPAGHEVGAGVLQRPVPVICRLNQSHRDGKEELKRQPQLFWMPSWPCRPATGLAEHREHLHALVRMAPGTCFACPVASLHLC